MLVWGSFVNNFKQVQISQSPAFFRNRDKSRNRNKRFFAQLPPMAASSTKTNIQS